MAFRNWWFWTEKHDLRDEIDELKQRNARQANDHQQTIDRLEEARATIKILEERMAIIQDLTKPEVGGAFVFTRHPDTL